MNRTRDISEELGKRIKLIRKALHISQKDFAQSINISGSFLSEIEAGKSKPGFEFFYHVTRVHNVSVPYVLHGEGEMFTKIDYGPTTTSKEPKDGKIDSLAELLWYLERSTLLKHNVMGFAVKFIYDNENAVKREIKQFSPDQE